MIHHIIYGTHRQNAYYKKNHFSIFLLNYIDFRGHYLHKMVIFSMSIILLFKEILGAVGGGRDCGTEGYTMPRDACISYQSAWFKSLLLWLLIQFPSNTPGRRR